jgi:pSer/pThr/pTyr-binding forkhead associated (FHA) protein
VPEYQPPAAVEPVFRSPNVTTFSPEVFASDSPFSPEAEPAVVTSEGNANGNGQTAVNARLVIERGDSPGAEFRLTGTESIIGRWDADNGVFPDVDLDVHDSEAKVSRRHARIRVQNGEHVIEDLGSTNGTYVNRGRRLLPGMAQVLKDGDELIVGKTFLRFHAAGS